MTDQQPPPRCRVPKCGKTVHLRKDGWYHDDGTYFCRSSAISRNSDDHAMPERRVSGERRTQNTGCKWDRGFTTPHECNGPPENERKAERRKAGKL